MGRVNPLRLKLLEALEAGKNVPEALRQAAPAPRKPSNWQTPRGRAVIDLWVAAEYRRTIASFAWNFGVLSASLDAEDRIQDLVLAAYEDTRRVRSAEEMDRRLAEARIVTLTRPNPTTSE